MSIWGYERKSFAEFEKQQEWEEGVMDAAKGQHPLLDKIQEQLNQAAVSHTSDKTGYTQTMLEVMKDNNDIFQKLDDNHIRVHFVVGKGREDKDHVMIIGSPKGIPGKACYPLNYFNKNMDSVVKVWNTLLPTPVVDKRNRVQPLTVAIPASSIKPAA